MNEILDYQINDERIYHGLMKRVGLEGEYQKNIVRIIYLISMLSASTFFVVPYLFYQNRYTCQNYDGDCNELVCSLPENQRTVYLSQPQIKSLGNFYGDMHCQKMSVITDMQQAFLVGTSVGLIIIVIFVEYLGRKMAITSSILFTIVSLLLIVFVNSIKIKQIGLFFWGSASQISFSILLSFVTEKTAQHNRVSYYIWIQVWFVMGCLANWAVFYVFRDWQLVLGFYFILLYVVAFGLFWHYVESPPLDLISRYTSKEAFEAFLRIASRNSIKDHGITIEQIEACQCQYQQNQKKKHNFKFNFFDLFSYASIRGNFLKLSLVFLVVSFLLYGPVFLLDSLKIDFFLLSIINVICQALALPFQQQVMLNHPRSKVQTILMTISTIFCFIIFGLSPEDCLSCGSQLKLVLTLIAYFIFRIVVNLSSNLFSCSLQQTFPAQIRSIAIYSVIAVGRLATVVVPYQTKIKEYTQISLMLQFSFISVVGIVAMAIMKQTWRVLPGEMIEELAIEHHQWKGKQK